MPWIGDLFSLWKSEKLYNLLARNGWWSLASICRVCGALDARSVGVCDACLADFPRRPQTKLQRTIAAVDVAFAAYLYDFPITSLVKSVKFHNDLSALAVLQAGFSETFKLQLGEIDFLVPVPLSPGRFFHRGFNQAGELARCLGKVSGKPVRYDMVKRQRGGAPQSLLGADARHNNTKGVFRTTSTFSGKQIALIDDVITTGATCSSLAEVLRDAGAARIICLAVAATPHRQADRELGLV